MIQRTLKLKIGQNAIQIDNLENNIVFARIINSGKLPLGNEISESRGLTVSLDYKDLKEKRYK